MGPTPQQGELWIIDARGLQPKRKLVTNDAYFICSSYRDAQAGVVWVFACAPNASTEDARHIQTDAVYRYPLTNGELDEAQKQLVWNSRTCRLPFTVSGDGAYCGSNMPWPEVWVGDLLTGAGTRINVPGSAWACWVNIAPDNSGRLFHMNNAHNAIAVYQKPYAAAPTWIRIDTLMPGNKPGSCASCDTRAYDVCGPRWSTHPRFITATYPMNGPDTVGSFCVGRFNGTYSAMTFIRLTDGKYRDKMGFLWVDNVPSAVGRQAVRVRCATQQFPRSDGPESEIFGLSGRMLAPTREKPGESSAPRALCITGAGGSPASVRCVVR